jgi:hypothetical protein
LVSFRYLGEKYDIGTVIDMGLFVVNNNVSGDLDEACVNLVGHVGFASEK